MVLTLPTIRHSLFAIRYLESIHALHLGINPCYNP